MHIDSVERVTELKNSLTKLKLGRKEIENGTFMITIVGDKGLLKPSGVFAEAAKAGVIGEIDKQISLAKSELKVLGVLVD